ncbi:MAG: hypothetical protein ACTSUQ_09940 [Candidatus Freyarchaeota archaeon]
MTRAVGLIRMRVLLINVPYPFNEWPTLPLGLCYIAGVLERESY